MYIKPGDKGITVKRLQELLSIEPDGNYGPKTKKAVQEFQKENGLRVTGIADVAFWASLIGRPYHTLPIGSIIDLRGVKPRLFGSRRTWLNIEGVTLHQTGCQMPSNPYNWQNVNYHYGVTRSGVIVYANDETDMIWHAQGLSQRTLGVVFEGNFAGVSGNMKTVYPGGGPASTLSIAQKKAAFILLDHLKIQFEQNKCDWKRIYAHRQSSEMRRADPGENIWKLVALQWKHKLKLGDFYDGGPGYKITTGAGIPTEWDISRKEKY